MYPYTKVENSNLYFIYGAADGNKTVSESVNFQACVDRELCKCGSVCACRLDVQILYNSCSRKSCKIYIWENNSATKIELLKYGCELTKCLGFEESIRIIYRAQKPDNYLLCVNFVHCTKNKLLQIWIYLQTFYSLIRLSLHILEYLALSLQDILFICTG